MPGLDYEQIEMWEYWSPDGPPTTAKKAKLRCYDPMDMVKEFAKVTGQEPNPRMSATLILEEFGEWDNQYVDNLRAYNKDYEAELKELADLIYVIYGYANVRGWDLDEAVRRVHDNNVGRCIQPDGSIKRREDGKVLKNPDFPKVSLEDLV